jgi:hypothetical protein
LAFRNVDFSGGRKTGTHEEPETARDPRYAEKSRRLHWNLIGMLVNRKTNKQIYNIYYTMTDVSLKDRIYVIN